MMSKFTIILTVLIAMTIKTNAQIPNNGFENWTTINSYDSLSGWGSTNYLSTGSFYAVTKSIDHYPTTVGAYSVRIENNIALLSNYSGVGCINTGGFGPKHPVFPITGHPTSLTGYYKFAPQNGDTMGIVIRLYLNGVQVTHNDLTSTVSESNWTSFNIPIASYTSADSAFISISPSNFDGNVAKIHGNSVLYVDNLNFDNLITSVSEKTSVNTLFNLYPNPASNVVTLNIGNTNNNADLTLNIYNVIGTLVKSKPLNQNQRQINIGDLSNGIYMVTIKSKDFTETQKLIIQR
jgi:hypothetical protein